MRLERKARRETEGFVTVTVAGQRFGISVARVDHVFVPDAVYAVPLAPPEIAGLINLRGKILTAVDLRPRLNLPKRAHRGPMVALEIETYGGLYGLLADGAGDVMWAAPASVERAPSNLDARWADLCAGLCQLEDGLLVALDVDRVLNVCQSAP